jgi:CheY-like chemotaxis protein
MMRILIAEDDEDISSIYKRLLERRGHCVIVTNNGEDCLTVYHQQLDNTREEESKPIYFQPFDMVLLDYKMPKRDGLEVAKEILAVNPRQQIIFASAFIEESKIETELKSEVKLLSKPFSNELLIDVVEDQHVYSELEKMGINTKEVKEANFSHKQLIQLLKTLRDISSYEADE